MTKRLITLLAALMLLTFAVAACGDDDNGGGSNGDGQAQTESGDDSGTTEGDDTTETDPDATVESGDTAAPANLDEAIEQCKESVDQAPNISEDSKSKLQDICEKAGSGDREDIEKAAREVCETIVRDSLPEGTPGREAALDACENTQQ